MPPICLQPNRGHAFVWLQYLIYAQNSSMPSKPSVQNFNKQAELYQFLLYLYLESCFLINNNNNDTII